MSRKPSVVRSAVLAPVRSRMVLMATVEPCRNRPAERKSLPAFCTPVPMPLTRRRGVDKVLPKVSAPVSSSNTAMSVKVPPMSAARRTVWRALAARGFDVGTPFFLLCGFDHGDGDDGKLARVDGEAGLVARIEAVEQVRRVIG